MSGQLVLYGAHALAGYKRGAVAVPVTRAAKRTKVALGVINHMYRNRGKYKRAARVIGRAWRRRRKSAKRHAFKT